MKILNPRWRLIALIPLVALAILSVENRTGAVADQNKEVREAANEIGIVVQGGITHGQILRFNVARLATIVPGPPVIVLRVFDAEGNVLTSHVFVVPNQNQGNTALQSSFFDLNADQLPSHVFDNSGRATVIGFAAACGEIGDICNPQQAIINDRGSPKRSCGFVLSGEIFNISTGQTLIQIAGTPISECARRDCAECR
jgi:hypothetical protein